MLAVPGSSWGLPPLLLHTACCTIPSLEIRHTSHRVVYFLVAQMVRNLPAVQETQVQSLGQEDFLEKGMATHSSMLAWRIPWTENGVLQSTGYKDLDKTE